MIISIASTRCTSLHSSLLACVPRSFIHGSMSRRGTVKGNAISELYSKGFTTYVIQNGRLWNNRCEVGAIFDAFSLHILLRKFERKATATSEVVLRLRGIPQEVR
jgi:hypothetical protein